MRKKVRGYCRLNNMNKPKIAFYSPRFNFYSLCPTKRLCRFEGKGDSLKRKKFACVLYPQWEIARKEQIARIMIYMGDSSPAQQTIPHISHYLRDFSL